MFERARKALRKLWKGHFLLVELAACILLTLSLAYIIEIRFAPGWLNGLLDRNRSGTYTAIASVYGSLLGFVVTAFAIILGYRDNERLTSVFESRHSVTLWAVFTSSMRWLGFATAAALLALIFDRDVAPQPIFAYFVAFGVLIGTARILRTLWVVENLVRIITKPEAEGQSREAEPTTVNFVR